MSRILFILFIIFSSSQVFAGSLCKNLFYINLINEVRRQQVELYKNPPDSVALDVNKDDNRSLLEDITYPFSAMDFIKKLDGNIPTVLTGSDASKFLNVDSVFFSNTEEAIFSYTKRKIPIVGINNISFKLIAKKNLRFLYKRGPQAAFTFNLILNLPDNSKHIIKLVIPIGKKLSPEKMLYKVLFATAMLPVQKIKLLRKIVINPVTPRFPISNSVLHGLTKPNKRKIYLFYSDVYPTFFSGEKEHVIHVMRHEFGHLLAYYMFGSITPNGYYKSRARLDRSSISNYGNIWQEEFAEFFQAYMTFDGGNLFETFKENFPNRVGFWDKYLKVSEN